MYNFYHIKFRKKYICSLPQWHPVWQRVEERRLYKNKKSDVIIYHLKSYLFMRQKENEILGWIHPELFNLKWLIPYKAGADPSSVLINTLSLFLNRKQEEKDGEEKKKKLLTFSWGVLFLESVGFNAVSAKFVKFSLIIEADENMYLL